MSKCASAGFGLPLTKRSPDCQPANGPPPQRLVEPLVLGQQLHARVAPGAVGGALQPAVLRRERDAGGPVGRPRLVAVLVEVEAEARASSRSSRPPRCRRSSAASSRPSEARLTSSRFGYGRSGEFERAVRVEREAVGGRGLEALAVAGAQPVPARRRRSRARAGTPAGAGSTSFARRSCPREDIAPISTWAPGSAARIAGPRGAHEPAVEVRRHRRAAPVRARRLRQQPRREVGLVPDDVAVDLGAVARRHLRPRRPRTCALSGRTAARRR